MNAGLYAGSELYWLGSTQVKFLGRGMYYDFFDGIVFQFSLVLVTPISVFSPLLKQKALLILISVFSDTEENTKKITS